MNLLKTLNGSFLFLAFLVSFNLFSQQDYSVEELQKKFPSEKAVIISSLEHVLISTKNDTFSIKSNNYEEILYLSDLATIYAGKSIQYSSFVEVKNIVAKSLIPNAQTGKYTTLKVKNFNTSHVSSDGIFYDDQEQISFSYPSVSKGSKSILQYTNIYKDPRFLGSSFFISHLPTLNSEFKISFPDNVEIGYKVFNQESSGLVFSESKEGNIITYSWKASDVLPFNSIDGAPEYTYYTPHIIVYIKRLKLASKTFDVFPDTKGYYNWSYSLLKDLNVKQDSSLKLIVDSLVKNVSDPDEKAKLIFYWVQDNIKYVAFEDGMGGFVPRQAAAVCQKRYGDCKDMASIITEMLKYAGIDGHLTLVGARNLPYKYSEISTPSVDNHMISSYRNKKNEVVFLYATGSYTPYGMPTAMIQGKETLIGKGADLFEIETVPTISKNQNLLIDKTEISLDETTVKGKGTMTTTGYAKLDFVYPLLDKNDQKRLETFQSMLQKGSNKFLVESLNFKGMSNRDSALTAKYEFKLQNYAQFNGDEIYVNLNLEKKLNNFKIDVEKRRGVSLEFDYSFKDINEVVLTLPKGYMVEFVPENVSYHSEHFGFDIKYEIKNNQIVLKTEVYNDLLLVKAVNFEEWNLMIKKLNLAYKELVILKKTSVTQKK